jgi:hypothetical protein
MRVRKTVLILWLIASTLGVGATPSLAQVRTIDPNSAIDSDLKNPQPSSPPPPRDYRPAEQDTTVPPGPQYQGEPSSYQNDAPPAGSPQYPPYDPSRPNVPAGGLPATADHDTPRQDATRREATANAGKGETFQREELLRAAEGTFGKGAAGLAGILERTLKEQGLPNAYISGREASAAIAVGLRYGKGTMFHKVEGQRPVYWTGPSLGFDLGGDANKVFVLVYNLYDTEELYHRFPAGEGRLYFVGGFAATYLRRGNTVLIPIRLGVGWRQGVNIGYMKFSHKSRWFPF